MHSKLRIFMFSLKITKLNSLQLAFYSLLANELCVATEPDMFRNQTLLDANCSNSYERDQGHVRDM
jgi:hypothetical protein